METRECIRTRRSIRRFTDQPVSEEQFKELLEAIRWSPSWANTQCWEVVAVREREAKEKLASLVIRKDSPAAQGLIEAPLVLVMCGRVGLAGFHQGQARTDKGDWYMFDLGIACQNLCLAAHAMGLGTVHMGGFDHPALDDYLGLPPDVHSVEMIPVGYPAQEAASPARKELSVFVHLEKYGQRIV